MGNSSPCSICIPFDLRWAYTSIELLFGSWLEFLAYRRLWLLSVCTYNTRSQRTMFLRCAYTGVRPHLLLTTLREKILKKTKLEIARRPVSEATAVTKTRTGPDHADQATCIWTKLLTTRFVRILCLTWHRCRVVSWTFSLNKIERVKHGYCTLP